MPQNSQLFDSEPVTRPEAPSKIAEAPSLTQNSLTAVYGEKHTRNPQPIPAVERQIHCDFCKMHGLLYGRGKYIGKPYDILCCPTCGLLWTNPLIYLRTEDHNNNEDYWAEEVYLANAEPQKQRFREQLRLFMRTSYLRNLRTLQVLEVGCGLGFFLDVCKEFDINAVGCDIEAPAVSYANREGPRARLGTLDSAYLNESFDAIFAFNLIEHLPHPHEFLAEAQRVLRPGGSLILETPVRESLFHGIARIADRITGGRLNFYGLHPGGHVYKFSKRTFKSFCLSHAFGNVMQKNINSPFSEIWGKSAIAVLDNRLLYRVTLPLLWVLARVTKRGNRLFIILRKADALTPNESEHKGPRPNATNIGTLKTNAEGSDILGL